MAEPVAPPATAAPPPPPAPAPPPEAKAAPAAAPTQTMFRPDTGEEIAVPASEMAEMYRKGIATFDEGQTVYLQRGGRTEAVSGSRAAELFTGPGGLSVKPSTPGAFAEQTERDEYGGIGGGAAATAAGLARGLTFGASDLGAEALGYNDELAALRRQHGLLSTGAEIGGAVLPALFSGGTSAAASGTSLAARVGRTATTLGRGAEAIGGAAERLAVRGAEALGAAEAGATARVLGGAAREAATGALTGVGQAISESSLRGDDLTVEKLLAGGGMGAMIGGALGGGLAGMGVVLEGVAQKSGMAAKALLNEENRLGKLIAGEARPEIEAVMVDRALKASGATEQAIANLSGAERQRVATRLLDEVPELVESKSLIGASGKRTKIADVAELEAKKAGDGIASTYAKLDEAAAAKGLQPEAGKAVDIARRTALEPLEAAGAKEAKAVRTYLANAEDAIAKAPGSGLKALRKEADFLDGVAAKATSPAEREALGVSAKILRGEAERASYAVAKDLGEAGAGAELRALHARESDFGWLAKASREGGGGPFEALKQIVAAVRGAKTGSSVGAALGAAVGGPAGAAVGSSVLGAGGAFASALFRQMASSRADAAAAVLAKRALTSDLLTAVTKTVDELVDAGVRKAVGQRVSSVVSKGVVASHVVPDVVRPKHGDGKPVRERYEKEQREVSQFVASRGATGKPVTDRVRNVVPDVASAVDAKTLAIAQAIMARTPQGLPAMLPGFGPSAAKGKGAKTAGPGPSKSEMASWLRYKAAAIDPLVALDALAHKKLAPEHVDALADNYPELLKQIRSTLMETVASGGALGMHNDDRVRLGLLLGVPTVPLMVPGTLAAVQQVFAPKEEGAPPGEPQGLTDGMGAPGGGTRGFDVDRAEGLETKTDRLESA